MFWLLLEKAFQQISEFVTNIGWDVGVAELYLVKKLGATFRVERGKPNHHFVDKRSETPPVHWLSMALLVENLRSEVLGGSTNGEGVIVGDFHFGQSEVS